MDGSNFIDTVRVTFTLNEFLIELQTRALVELSKIRRGVRWGDFSFRLFEVGKQDWGNGWQRDAATLQWGHGDFGSAVELLSPHSTVAIGLFGKEKRFEADCEHAYAYYELIEAIVTSMVEKVMRHEREKSDGTL